MSLSAWPLGCARWARSLRSRFTVLGAVCKPSNASSHRRQLWEGPTRHHAGRKRWQQQCSSSLTSCHRLLAVTPHAQVEGAANTAASDGTEGLGTLKRKVGCSVRPAVSTGPTLHFAAVGTKGQPNSLPHDHHDHVTRSIFSHHIFPCIVRSRKLPRGWQRRAVLQT